MVKDEAIEDHKVGGLGPDPSRRTLARSDATGVMSWGIESEIVHNSKIG